MYTINDFISHYNLQNFKKYYQALATDDVVIQKIATFDEKKFESYINFFEHDFYDIRAKLVTPPTDDEMQMIIRATLCADSCGELAFILYSDRLKKQCTVETVLSILSRCQTAQFDLGRIVHQVRYYSEYIRTSPELINFFLTFNDEELHHLKACQDQLSSPDSLEGLKKLSREILESKTLCDWYAGELDRALENRDPKIITAMLSTHAFQQYSELKNKKPVSTILEFVIKHDFTEYIQLDRLIGSDPKKLKLAMTAAIVANKPVTVSVLCAMGALKLEHDFLNTAAFVSENLEIFKMLIAAGANADDVAHSLVFTAARGNPVHINMMLHLLEATQNNCFSDCLADAVSIKSLELVQMFIENGVLDQLNKDQKPLLMLAIEKDALEVVPLLLASKQKLEDTYENKSIWDCVNEYEHRHYELSPAAHKDYLAELPLIREALRDALTQLAANPDPSVNLREMMATLLDAKHLALVEKNKKSHTSFTLINLFQNKIQWRVPLEPTSLRWSLGDDANKLHSIATSLIGYPVKIISIDPWDKEKQLLTQEGILCWYDQEGGDLVGFVDYTYGIYIKNIQTIEVTGAKPETTLTDPKKMSTL